MINIKDTVIINPEYAECFLCEDVKTLYTVLDLYENTGIARIAPIASTEDFECGYDHRNIISAEIELLIVRD